MAIRKSYPTDPSITYAGPAGNGPGQSKKEKKITPQASLLLLQPKTYRRPGQHRTTLGLLIPFVALRVSTTNWASLTIFL
jgi:hypothetical protein